MPLVAFFTLGLLGLHFLDTFALIKVVFVVEVLDCSFVVITACVSSDFRWLAALFKVIVLLLLFREVMLVL